MLGPEGTAELARTWLAAALPARLAAIATRLNVPAGTLPPPSTVAAYDRARLAVEEWPAVVVEVENLRKLELIDVVDQAGELYRTTYAARLYVWVRGDGYAEVDLVRKRYTLAVREVCLANKSLRPFRIGTAVDNAPIAVDPASIRESLSPELTDDTGRTIAGAFLDLDLITLELLTGPPSLGTVNVTRVDERPLPPVAHPAL